MRWTPAVLLVVLLAASCGRPAVKLTQQEVSPSYAAGEFGYAGARGAIRVMIAGDPLDTDPEGLAEAVTDAMKGRHWGPRTDFTTSADPRTRPSYRVVMMFNPAPTMIGMRLCREDPAGLPVEQPAEGLILFAAFCLGSESRTEIKGRIAGPSNPENAGFAELVGQVTHALFPPERGIDDENTSAPPWLQND